MLRRIPEMAGRLSKEVARAIPTSRGKETPGQLHTYHTQTYTLFTEVGPQQKPFYSADQWITIRLELETAGPVAISTNKAVTPVLSGKGILRPTGREYETRLSKGERIYYAAESINRVKVTIEPIPWLQQIAGEITEVVKAIATGFGKRAAAPGAPTTRSGKTIDDLQCPPPPRAGLPTLRRR